jgi:hypothetical protein
MRGRSAKDGIRRTEGDSVTAEERPWSVSGQEARLWDDADAHRKRINHESPLILKVDELSRLMQTT